LEFLSKKGIIQEGERSNLGAGSAWPLFTGFSQFLHKQQTWLGAPLNTKQVRKPNMSKKLLAFTRLMLQIWDPTYVHFAPDVNRADCGSPHKESKG
jgi:hypothetical protein